MNDAERESRFKEKLHALLEEFKRSIAHQRPYPYTGAEDDKPLEHTTRVHLLDGIVTALGWTLGPAGDVIEEARIKAETTTFIDYLGVGAADRAPQLIVEAKAWGKPFVAPRRGGGRRKSPDELIVEAIGHLRDDRDEDTSPVIALWHGYLKQVRSYVRDLRDQYGHAVSRVMLTSGQWMVIFRDPVTTFLGPGHPQSSQIALFEESQYVERSTDLLDLVGLSAVSTDIPATILSSHLGIYIRPKDIVACFHGIHLIYKDVGSSFFGPRPNILLYPTMIFQRVDGAVLVTMDRVEPIPFPHRPADFQAHFDAVNEAANALKQRCERTIHAELRPRPVESFVGFPRPPRPFAQQIDQAPCLVALQPRVGEYRLATGVARHFLSAVSAVDPCRFHLWAQAHNVGSSVGLAAINHRSMEPRSYFIDGEHPHCAHVAFEPARDGKCHLSPIDRRICCQACIYKPVCWPDQQLEALPCGT